MWNLPVPGIEPMFPELAGRFLSTVPPGKSPIVFNYCCCFIHSLSHFQLFATPRTAAHQPSLSFTISRSLLKPMSIESLMPSNHLISVVPFSSCLQSVPASSGGQSIGVSASASVLPINIQNWFPLGLIALIALQSKGLSRVFSNTSSKASIPRHSAVLIVQLSHPYMTTGKIIALTRQTFVSKVMSLLFKMLSSLVIAFLWRASIF